MYRLTILFVALALTDCVSDDSGSGLTPDASEVGADTGSDGSGDQGLTVYPCGYCSGTLEEPVWTACSETLPLNEWAPEQGACQCVDQPLPGGAFAAPCVPSVDDCACILSPGRLCEWPTTTRALDGFDYCDCADDRPATGGMRCNLPEPI